MSAVLTKNNSTCLDRLLCSSNTAQWTHVIGKLLESGAQYSVTSQLLYQEPNWQILRNTYNDLSQNARDCPASIEAVVLQDEKHLRSIIQQDRNSDRFIVEDSVALYKLCASIGWIRGCEILRQNDVKLSSSSGRRAVGVELFCDEILPSFVLLQQLEPLRYFLGIRWHMEEEELKHVGGLCRTLWMAKDRGSTEVIVASLAEQRRRLQALAEKSLGCIGGSCWSKPGRLLDAHAGCAVRQLAAKGIDVPASLKPCRGSVYYTEDLWPIKVGTLDLLFSAGFQDISAKDFKCSENLTPLPPLLKTLTDSHWMMSSSVILETAQWYISKGVSLRDTGPRTRTTAMHFLGWYLGIKTSDERRINKDIRFIKGALTNIGDWSDGCQCACSSAGCLLLHTIWKGHDIDWPRQASRILAWYVTEVQSASDSSFVVLEFIRAYVFDALQMRHTCCDLRSAVSSGKSSESPRIPAHRHSRKETERIQEEDAPLRDFLEELVPKLFTSYTAFKKDLVAFVDEILDTEIEKALVRLLEDDERFSLGRRQLGVVMEASTRVTGATGEDDEYGGSNAYDTEESESDSSHDIYEFESDYCKYEYDVAYAVDYDIHYDGDDDENYDSSKD